jgi:drug/metabolite transporter (DMT)-like permease
MSPTRAAFAALFVTVLWSTSWVLIRLGLATLDPLVFAGLRYAVAAVLLLALLARRAPDLQALRSADPHQWRLLGTLGVVLYAVTQGAQFVSLALLPAATASLVLTFTPVVVALVSARRLGEPPTPVVWLGLALAVGGAAAYLRPSPGEEVALAGLAVATLGMLANASSAVLGRRVNRDSGLSPLAVTAPSMAIGAAALLLVGIPAQGLPQLDGGALAIVAWLAVVNTAGAFTLWSATQRHLTATVSSAINNTMLIQIAVLAWVVLGEALTGVEVVALLVVAAGTLAVQLGSRPRPAPGPTATPAGR